MGCSSSKLDDGEAIELCKDSKNFIKKVVEHRTKFASGHIAYLWSVKRVSASLKDYVEGDEPREFSIDSFTTPPPYAATKKTTPRFITIYPNSVTIESKVHYLRPGGNPSIFVEERLPDSPESVIIESYTHSPAYHYADSFFRMQSQTESQSSSSSSSSIFHYSRPNFPLPSPERSSQWDFFGQITNNDHQSVLDDDINGLQQVREEEGILELEEETEQEQEETDHNHENEVTVEDVDKDDDEDEDEDDDEFETDSGEEAESEHEGLVMNIPFLPWCS